jgi:hypothetical protein
MKVVAPRLEIQECRPGAEFEFVSELNSRAEKGAWSADYWPRDDRLLFTVCPSDREHNCVLRTLRIDFDGARVVFGPDETHQLVTDLDPGRPGVRLVSGISPTAMADAAADWIERELARPIVRREWKGMTFTHREWILDDTGERLAWSDSENRPRPDLAEPSTVTFVSGRAG